MSVCQTTPHSFRAKDESAKRPVCPRKKREDRFEIEFHNLLARASKNHVFVIVSGSLAAAVRDILTRIMPEGSDDAVPYDDHVINSKNSVFCHEKILEAFMQKDKERASQILEEHLKEVRRRLESLMA